MGFYYISIFSLALLGVIYAALVFVFWGIARFMRDTPWRKVVLAVVGVVFLVLPIAEELWIAWNFGQACKEAGTFIYRKVQVDGFYDDTAHWWRQLSESKYQFVESREQGKRKYWRVERVGNEIKHFEISHPTARYHYKFPHQNTPMSHKVSKIERVVVDSQTGEVLARETKYARTAYWFFIHLDRPVMLCPTTGQNPLSKYGSVYNVALEPVTTR